MPYKKPGAYARFVKTAGAVNNPGSTRVMAIVGTGKMFFDQLNEAVLRGADGVTDSLKKQNVYEIYHVTSKPLKNGVVDLTNGGVEYKIGLDFDLKDGNSISWKIKTGVGNQPAVTSTAGTSAGSTEFKTKVSAAVGSDYLVKDGKYKVEITYIDAETPALGTYSISNQTTGEVLGEFQVDADANTVIPGINLFVTDTFIQAMTSDQTPVAIPGVSKTSTGDYVILDVVGATAVTGTPGAGGAPADSAAYYVSYAYKKAEEDYAPKLFTDYQELVAEYGDYDVTASGKVINSLALGAEIAFTNGVNPIVCVQAKNDSDFAIQRAIAMLESDVVGINNINTIIPLSTSKNVAAFAKNHVNDMSSETIGKERMLFVGAPDGESVTDSAAAAATFNDERVVYIVPGSATKQIRDTSTGVVSTRRVPGSFLAVAVAALGLKNDPAEPYTNKYISGFDSLGTLYTESEKNIMAEKGCLVLEQYGANIKVRHGQTTSVAEVNSNEITLIQIKDYVIDASRKTLGDLYVGKKLLPSIVNDVQLTLVNTLSQFKGQEIILSYGAVSVKRSKDDPRAIDVKFEIEAVYPLNYINIEFSFSGVN